MSLTNGKEEVRAAASAIFSSSNRDVSDLLPNIMLIYETLQKTRLETNKCTESLELLLPSTASDLRRSTTAWRRAKPPSHCLSSRTKAHLTRLGPWLPISGTPDTAGGDQLEYKDGSANGTQQPVMARSFFRTSVLAATCIASAAASSEAGVESRQSQEPCGQIAKLLSDKSTTFLPADTALACLQSVPLDKANNPNQIAGLKQLIGFQSDLSYLIKPPPGYLYPPVDIEGGLDSISNNLKNGLYKNEYDFQTDIYKLVASAYDGHFAYTPDILSVFVFLRLYSDQVPGQTLPLYPLISVSTDGISLPSLYSGLDQAALASTNGAGYKPSVITKINGQNAESFLETYASTNGNGRQQDPDANYNFLFPNIPSNSVPSFADGYGNFFAQSTLYLGTATVLTFANGTTSHVLTSAAVPMTLREKFVREVTDGPSFFKAFCSGNIQGSPSGSASAAAPSRSVFAAPASSFAKRDIVTERQYSSAGFGGFGGFSAAPSSVPINSGLPFHSAPVSQVPVASGAPSMSGSRSGVPSSQVPYSAVPTTGAKGSSPAFPTPIVVADDFSVAGYFPEAQNDLAVLSIPSYGPKSASQFSNIVRELLATAHKYKKTKLIIDLRGNPGGTALLATDTFKQLFPSMDPYGAGNYRANPLFNFTGNTLSDFFEGKTYKQAAQLGIESLYAGTPFNFEELVSKSAKDFGSWADFYGPNFHHGDDYTSITRYNLSDKAQRTHLSIYGYGMDDKPQPQTFESQNIILVQDGACASTCTLFSELMKNQAHVRTVAIGGRPKNGPMQGVGGIKGANIMGMLNVWEFAEVAYKVGTPAQQQYFQNNFASSAPAILQALNRAAQGGEFGVQATVNFRNNFREDDSTVTPLQYIYEAADCRLFYTAAMYEQQDLVWSKAYDAIWGNGNCVPGSTGQTSSGFGSGYALGPPPQGVAVDDTIYPSKNLGSAVKASATAHFNTPPAATSTGKSGAAGLGVSMGAVVGVAAMGGLLFV